MFPHADAPIRFEYRTYEVDESDLQVRVCVISTSKLMVPVSVEVSTAGGTATSEFSSASVTLILHELLGVLFIE